MDWKLELDALIESTMAFAKDVKSKPISDLALVVSAAKQALADKSRPIPRPAAITPMTRPTSERDEILRHVNNFRAHQEKMAREREGYYLQARAKLLAFVDPNLTSLNSQENSPATGPAGSLVRTGARARCSPCDVHSLGELGHALSTDIGLKPAGGEPGLGFFNQTLVTGGAILLVLIFTVWICVVLRR